MSNTNDTTFVLTPSMLKTLRARLNYSQQDLATKIGLSPKYGHMTICVWENQADRCARVKDPYLKKIKQLIKTV
jgi:DNA-binding XRE family transcriptional regulator